MSPVAAGGYFWAFFDSLRHFGSLGIRRASWFYLSKKSALFDYVGFTVEEQVG